MALPSAPQEREQGAVQAQEALEATAPPPLEPTPAQADVASQEAVVQSAQQAVMGNEAEPDMPQSAPAGYTVKNPYMLLPSRVLYGNFNRETVKTPVEKNYSAGLLWDALAQDSSASPIVRQIAQALKDGS